MTTIIDLPPEIQEWLNYRLQAGEFAAPAEFVQSRLRQDWLEEKMDDTEQEPFCERFSGEIVLETLERVREQIGDGKGRTSLLHAAAI